MHPSWLLNFDFDHCAGAAAPEPTTGLTSLADITASKLST
jgi:hypothetical protein